MNGDMGETAAALPLPQVKSAADKSAARWLLLAMTAVGLILLAAWSSSGDVGTATAAANTVSAKVAAPASGVHLD
ncbi:MAG: hypothetical protein PW843_21325 [Azospirillaceae bacterium]|nr:hypothetical protein [Azospirillaceae bacterium]